MLAQTDVRNVLLRAMTEEDFASIAPHLERVEMLQRQTLLHENRRIPHVYFPERGLCAKIAVSGDGEMIEAGVFGYEGMSDMIADIGQIAPLRVIAQSPGEALRLPVEHLTGLMARSPPFLLLMMKYQQNLTTQVAYTALSHGAYSIPERLARWMLMARDRLGDELPAVHEFLSIMLGVRRAGVTEAIHQLESRGAIKASRGRIQILDRGALLDMAGGGYGAAEDEYERLIGGFGRAKV